MSFFKEGQGMELDKHKKYKSKYGEKELFWGLGIEEETYFQFTRPIYAASPLIRDNHKAERYSVDYYKSLKPVHKEAFKQLFPDASGFVPLPYFFNGHSFQSIDVQGNHRTTYEAQPKPNPKFIGSSFFEDLQHYKPKLFKDQHEITFTFDGDTVEFITQNFYKAKVPEIIQELKTYKATFLKTVNDYILKMNLYRDKGLLMYPPRNPGFAVFHSNPQNIVMFNSGTYHINITLPTLLGSRDAKTGLPELLYPELFEDQHKRCILFYQWLEPILIAIYGTPDPFSSQFSDYSSSSQRCAVSRYIGIGSYDTTQMRKGKYLTEDIEKIRGSDTSYWWYSRYHQTSGYIALNKIGMDINYRKHYNHGIELRFFDWFPESQLQELIELLVYVADAALIISNEPPEPVMSETWNDLVLGILKEGKDLRLTPTMLATYEKILGLPLFGLEMTVADLYVYLRDSYKKKYSMGMCARMMLPK